MRSARKREDKENAGNSHLRLSGIASILLLFFVICFFVTQRLLIHSESVDIEKKNANLYGNSKAVSVDELGLGFGERTSAVPNNNNHNNSETTTTTTRTTSPVSVSKTSNDIANDVSQTLKGELVLETSVNLRRAPLFNPQKIRNAATLNEEMLGHRNRDKKPKSSLKQTHNEQQTKPKNKPKPIPPSKPLLQTTKTTNNNDKKKVKSSIHDPKNGIVSLHSHTQGPGAKNGERDSVAQALQREHPQISPRSGTPIGFEFAENILACKNQSQCIVPELQLVPKLKIYLCSHPVRQGVRFYFLTREGLLLHPHVELVNFAEVNTADFIVYLPGSAPWHRTECNDTMFADRLIVLDEFDGHAAFAPMGKKQDLVNAYPASNVREIGQWYFMMFKRSFVVRKRGVFRYFPHLDKPDMYAMTYSLAEAYLRGPFQKNRKWEIVCTLRGSRQQPARLRVQDWLKEYVADRHMTSEQAVTEQINKASRTSVNRHYFELMHSAEIIVTVNPSDWEGDFRLWESMASGALVFVDPIFAPHPYPLIHGEHVIFFNNENRTDLWEKLDYYRSHKEEARQIAIRGYLHSMKYHRTVNMLDYVLRSAHIKKMAVENRIAKSNDKSQVSIPSYIYSSQYLDATTKLQKSKIEKNGVPGKYKPVPFDVEKHYLGSMECITPNNCKFPSVIL